MVERSLSYEFIQSLEAYRIKLESSLKFYNEPNAKGPSPAMCDIHFAEYVDTKIGSLLFLSSRFMKSTSKKWHKKVNRFIA